MEMKIVAFILRPIKGGHAKQIGGELLELGCVNNKIDGVRRTMLYAQESKDKPISLVKPKSSSDNIVVITMTEGAGAVLKIIGLQQDNQAGVEQTAEYQKSTIIVQQNSLGKTHDNHHKQSPVKVGNLYSMGNK